MVDGLNSRDKRMLKLETEKQLKPRLIQYDPNVFKFMQVHENEEDQYVSLAKESKRVLSLIHTRDTKNNK